MKFHHANARLFVPDQVEEPFARITHLAIGAHPDDLEFMALHGILACHRSREKWFGGVVCTNGAGSVRSGEYADFTDEEMRLVRAREQEAAAAAGNYGAMIQLGYPSSEVKPPLAAPLKSDLLKILSAARPDVVYTHNPADKHDTHVAVFASAIQAMRELPPTGRPREVYGCEVWRGLDWMLDDEKVLHNVTAHENLAAALGGIFDSQIAGGKRYDLATAGRRRANATFFAPHAADECGSAVFAMPLTPLVSDPSLDIAEYVLGFIRRFEDDVRVRLTKNLACTVSQDKQGSHRPHSKNLGSL